MKTLLFSCLLLALASCGQPDPTTGTTTVQGQVVAQASRQPVPNASVQLYHKQNGGYQAVGARVPADAQGRYAFAFEATATTGYFLTAIAPPGYFTPEQNAPFLTAGQANKNVTIAMLAPAWVRLQLVDEPPKSRVRITTNGYEGASDTFYYPRDTVITRLLVAGSKPVISWWIDENGQTINSSKTLSPSALDTIKIRIAF